MAVASLVACIVLAIISVGILFFSMTFFYVPSSPNPETGEPDMVYRPRWRAVFVTLMLGALMACATFVFFAAVFLPASQIEEAEEMALMTFAEKVGRQPIRLEFSGPSFSERMSFMNKNGWKQTGTAWMDNDEVWDVSVKRANMFAITSLECVVTRRE